MGGGQANLLQYYMGGSAETPKLYYVIYEQPLTVSLTVKRPFFKTPLKTAVQNNASPYSFAVFFSPSAHMFANTYQASNAE